MLDDQQLNDDVDDVDVSEHLAFDLFFLESNRKSSGFLIITCMVAHFSFEILHSSIKSWTMVWNEKGVAWRRMTIRDDRDSLLCCKANSRCWNAYYNIQASDDGGAHV